MHNLLMQFVIPTRSKRTKQEKLNTYLEFWNVLVVYLFPKLLRILRHEQQGRTQAIKATEPLHQHCSYNSMTVQTSTDQYYRPDKQRDSCTLHSAQT